MESDDGYPGQDDRSSKMMAYHDLLNELRALIESARSKNIDPGCRTDRLKCQICGKQEEEIASFIVIDRCTEIVQRESRRCFLTAYDFICPACGLRQTSIIKKGSC